MNIGIRAIEYHLPSYRLTNEELATVFPERSAQELGDKAGVLERRIAAANECASDLGVVAARQMFDKMVCGPKDVDFILVCTQSPDYFLPTTSCLIQHRLGISTAAGALDINLGCSGYVYALGLAKGLIETGQSRRVLLLTADTYSRFLDPGDRSVRVLFGDGAAATLIEPILERNGSAGIGPFVFGTDGGGADDLIVREGGLRHFSNAPEAVLANCGTVAPRLKMNGPKVFDFTIRTVPAAVNNLLAKSNMAIQDVDLFVFHQASKYILDRLRTLLGIPEQRFYVSMKYEGNTVSSTIPIALRKAMDEGRLTQGSTVMLVGFGVGYSWAATVVKW